MIRVTTALTRAVGIAAFLLPLLGGCFMNETGISTEEAQRTYFRMRLGGLDFDVPASYFFQDFKTIGAGKLWPRPLYTERQKVDVFTITGLLPDMSPYTTENAAEFERLGWGKKVQAQISLGAIVDWTYYFAHAGTRLRRLPASNETPRGFMRFLDQAVVPDLPPERKLQVEKEVFMNSDKPVPGLVRILCALPGGAPSPSCEVITEYRQEYRLKYWFSRDYLGQWEEVDRAVKAVFDRFIETAAKSNP